jgi:Ca2+:H+ antiporter
MLFVATAAVAVVSELLVTSVSATARDLGMTNLFVGVVIVALVGNAAEHFSAVVLAPTTRWTRRLASPSDPPRRSRCSWRRRWSSSVT